MQYPWTPHRIAALQLRMTHEIGNRLLTQIASKYTDLSLFLSEKKRWENEGLSEKQQYALIQMTKEDVRKQMKILEASNIHFLLSTDTTFPSSLRHIPDPPFAIFCRGELIKESIAIAIVGTRKITSYGKACTRFFARELSEAQIPIVSGLAFGVDAEAHREALLYKQPVIAVLPGGVDDASIMPRTNLFLAKAILENHGCLISEYPPNTPIPPYQYLHRNRIIAGLSHAVIVIEADIRSGALTTAKLALEQGKEVFAVPGSIFSQHSKGTNQLIKDGATPSTCIEDIFSTLPLAPKELEEMRSIRAKNSLSEEELLFLQHFSEPQSIDDLVHKTQQSARNVHQFIATLELKGYISSEDGDAYRRIST